MANIDVKDKKILYQLQQDSRQSYKTIGKKVGLSGDLVLYRVKRLIEKNIIKNYTILIDWGKFGYSVMSAFYKFTHINPAIKENIIKFLVNEENTAYVSLIEGIYDMQIDFLLGEPSEFESLIDKIRSEYYKYLSFQTSFFYIRAEFYDYAFLLDNKIKRLEPIKWPWGSSFTRIDELDYKILFELSRDSRMPTKNIANKLNSTVNIVNYRIKKLIRKEIIRVFTVNIDWSKIGYRFFHLQLNLYDYNKKNEIINYMRKYPNLIRRFKMLTLDMDLHFTFLFQNMEQLRNIIEDISIKYPDSINDYRFYSTFKIFKFNYMIPKLLEEKNPLNKGDYL